MSVEVPTEDRIAVVETVRLPAPTAWPLVLAFGMTLVFSGLLTTASVSILGAILAICGMVGWFRDVLPHEKHEAVPVSPGTIPVFTSRTSVARIDLITHEPHRARLPLEIYPVSAGVKGGMAGAVVMAILAVGYGVFSGHGVWYPINLLAAGFFPGSLTSTAELDRFQWDAFLIATAIHLITSLLVGLLYGAMLPMLAHRAVLLGGVVAPVLWSGLIHSLVDYINPELNRRIDWLWFVVSQLGFGIVAGLVVSKQQRIATWQHLPFAIRAGIETPGAMDERRDEDRR